MSKQEKIQGHLTEEEVDKAKELPKFMYAANDDDGSDTYLNTTDDFNDGTFSTGLVVGVYALVSVHRIEKTEPKYILKGFSKRGATSR